LTLVGLEADTEETGEVFISILALLAISVAINPTRSRGSERSIFGTIECEGGISCVVMGSSDGEMAVM
jgi:hypothetical protein